MAYPNAGANHACYIKGLFELFTYTTRAMLASPLADGARQYIYHLWLKNNRALSSFGKQNMEMNACIFLFCQRRIALPFDSTVT